MSEKIIYLDDLPFNLNEQESELLMKKIPKNISGIAEMWGYNDSVFRDNLFEYIIKEILHFESIEKYYESDIFKKYTEKNELLSNSILIDESKKFRIFFDAVFYNKDFEDTPVHSGTFEMIANNINIVKQNSFLELSKSAFKDNLAAKKLEITKIEEI